jgi:ADP-heptose:LPS heptosyltransferase
VKKLARDILFKIVDKVATAGRVRVIPNTMLLVRVDAIGDYVLFRNFIKELRESEKYRQYKIILCGNVIWKDIATDLDSKYISEFVWLDKKKMVRDIGFRFRTLRKISRLGVEVAIQPTYSRDFYSGDSVIRASKAKEKIGCEADMTILTGRHKAIADKYYTRLLSISGDILFEFNRNKEVVELLTGQKISLIRPHIDSKDVHADWFQSPGRFVIICPSASTDTKKWSTAHFADVCDFLIREQQLHVVIVGGGGDKPLANAIMQSLDKSMVTDLTGKTSLSELSKIISLATLVVSNDTAAAHIGAAVDTPVVCVSRGDHFGRFTQYPGEGQQYFTTIYPPGLREQLDDKHHLDKNFRYKSKLDINSISPSDVKEVIKKVMSKQAGLTVK